MNFVLAFLIYVYYDINCHPLYSFLFLIYYILFALRFSFELFFSLSFDIINIFFMFSSFGFFVFLDAYNLLGLRISCSERNCVSFSVYNSGRMEEVGRERERCVTVTRPAVEGPGHRSRRVQRADWFSMHIIYIFFYFGTFFFKQSSLFSFWSFRILEFLSFCVWKFFCSLSSSIVFNKLNSFSPRTSFWWPYVSYL